MSRAHLSKRLPDAEAIRLFAEHHIVHVRRRKNGEIVAVKHATFGWMEPQVYYALQKIHDILPVLGPVISGAYQLKWAVANQGVSIVGVDIPLGGLAYGEALALGMILCSDDPLGVSDRLTFGISSLVLPKLDPKERLAFNKAAFSEGSLLIAGVLLPFGEVLLMWALGRMLSGKMYRWEDFFADVVWTFQGRPTIMGGEVPGPFAGGELPPNRNRPPH